MPLTIGSTLGPYVIGDRIGSGGMGEVYRGRDSRLGRDVAIKILPADFAADPERLARFEREARTLATLNHPHIAAIYGVEEAGRTRALVLELVGGGTLADRIARGPIPLREALPIAQQIADGLDAAHERGIVHRDLKPGNVALTTGGTVKLLDFGLAKAVDGGSGSQSQASTTPADTRAGVVLGTTAYMSPEQARGQIVDKRTDIWAFGCVLYEMLTGRAAFARDTTTDTLAAIVEREPDWRTLPAGAPRRVRELLTRCLEKDPRRRLRDVADAVILLDGEPDSPAAVVPGARRVPILAIAALALAVIAGIAGMVALRPPPPVLPWASEATIAAVDIPNSTTPGYSPPAVTADGRHAAWVASSADAGSHIWMHTFGGNAEGGRPAQPRVPGEPAAVAAIPARWAPFPLRRAQRPGAAERRLSRIARRRLAPAVCGDVVRQVRAAGPPPHRARWRPGGAAVRSFDARGRDRRDDHHSEGADGGRTQRQVRRFAERPAGLFRAAL